MRNRRTTTEQSFSASEQPRAKRPWCMQQYVSPDEIKKGRNARRKTQGGLQPIQGLRGESSHKAASEGKSSNVRAQLVVWVKVDGTAEETKIAMGS